MKFKEQGFMHAGVMTLLVGGTALAGLLWWGHQTGQELPLWPALAVAAVNIVGAVKIVMEIKKRKEGRS